MKINISRYIKWLVGLVILITIAFITHRILLTRAEAIKWENRSSLEGLWGFLTASYDKPEMKYMISNLSEEWSLLNNQEYIKLSNVLLKYYDTTSDPKHGQAGILFDHWGQHILIAGRKLNGKKPEWIIWSKGPDSIFGTEDDISYPWDISPPVTLIEEDSQ